MNKVRQKLRQLGKILKIENQKLERLIAEFNQQMSLVQQNKERLTSLRDGLEHQFSSHFAADLDVANANHNIAFLKRIDSNIDSTKIRQSELDAELETKRKTLVAQRARVKAIEAMISDTERQRDQKVQQEAELELNDNVIGKLFRVEL